MKKNLCIVIALLLTCYFQLSTAFGQSPNGMSYQAVIRDASDNLVTSQTVGMQISILQGSASGTAVYTETQTPTANANGLVSVEIGTGTTSDDFSSIDWANGPYFIKTETDPAGGTSYTITGTSQLLSVPYALHAKTADSLSSTITENDPVFSAWDKSTGISITENQISDLDHFTTADETDPVYGSSVASGITGTDTTNWNNKQDQIVAGTNITIVGNTISATGGGSSNDFYLGQDTLGGIVFYIYLDANGNQHGLIVSKTETTAKWQNTGVTTNATRSWDGGYNMNLMSHSPAKDWVTDNFSTDWYLPSIDELSFLWQNRFHTNKGLNDAGATLLSNSAGYWSSTEYSDTSAFSFFFYYGYTTNSNKPNTYRVRAVRAF
jgi:hypothetical protein